MIKRKKIPWLIAAFLCGLGSLGGFILFDGLSALIFFCTSLFCLERFGEGQKELFKNPKKEDGSKIEAI
jgi:hypothetical protein